MFTFRDDHRIVLIDLFFTGKTTSHQNVNTQLFIIIDDSSKPRYVSSINVFVDRLHVWTNSILANDRGRSQPVFHGRSIFPQVQT